MPLEEEIAERNRECLLTWQMRRRSAILLIHPDAASSLLRDWFTHRYTQKLALAHRWLAERRYLLEQFQRTYKKRSYDL